MVSEVENRPLIVINWCGVHFDVQNPFRRGRRQTFLCTLLFGRAVLASEAFYLQTFVTLSALDYYFKDYFKPWVVQFLTFVAKQCWPKLCLLARAGTFAWQHYLIVYSGDSGESFQLQTTLLQRWLGLWRRFCFFFEGRALFSSTCLWTHHIWAQRQCVLWCYKISSLLNELYLTLNELPTGRRSQASGSEDENRLQNEGQLRSWLTRHILTSFREKMPVQTMSSCDSLTPYNLKPPGKLPGPLLKLQFIHP